MTDTIEFQIQLPVDEAKRLKGVARAEGLPISTIVHAWVLSGIEVLERETSAGRLERKRREAARLLETSETSG